MSLPGHALITDQIDSSASIEMGASNNADVRSLPGEEASYHTHVDIQSGAEFDTQHTVIHISLGLRILFLNQTGAVGEHPR
jgi:hypothetical protein